MTDGRKHRKWDGDVSSADSATFMNEVFKEACERYPPPADAPPDPAVTYSLVKLAEDFTLDNPDIRTLKGEEFMERFRWWVFEAAKQRQKILEG